jgi:hypothetical protein
VSAVATKRQPKKEKPKQKRKPRVPPDVREQHVAAVLDLIAHHKHGTLKACTAVGIVPTQFYMWMKDDAKLRDRYVQAREIYFEAMREDCLDIADDGTNDYVERERKDGSTYVAFDSEHVQRSALRVNTRKWLTEVGRPASTNYGAKDDDEDAAQFAKAVAILAELAAQKVAA